ncbi:hypothetical protein MRX96_011012 [Rhipicephalus microplus]
MTRLVTYLLGRFYHHVSRYPKGPFPLPLVGNMLALRNVTDLHAKSTELSKTYGDVFTLWMAHRPMVMLNSYAVIREALVERRHDFAGRFPTRTAVLQNQGNHDIVFEDYNPPLEGSSESGFVSEEGPQVMDFRKPLFSLFCKVIGVSIYGRRLHEEQDDIERLGEHQPPRKRWQRCSANSGRFFTGSSRKPKANYIPGSVENFTHAMLAAREEAIKEDKADAQYLTKPSMILATVNLFNAGSNTSTGTLQWLLLRIATEESLQARIRKEIEDNIGSRPPAYGDREKLPFTIACLLETLRMHPATPLGIPHNTTTDTRVGKWDIPKDTGNVVQHLRRAPRPKELGGARGVPSRTVPRSRDGQSVHRRWSSDHLRVRACSLHPARQNIVYTRRR